MIYILMFDNICISWSIIRQRCTTNDTQSIIYRACLEKNVLKIFKLEAYFVHVVNCSKL